MDRECGDASYNLANPCHCDVADAWRSFAIWVRGNPGNNNIPAPRDHWFLFPDVGLAIELVDGVAISWDGRVAAHCTSMHTGLHAEDGLYSLFFSLPRAVVSCEIREQEMDQA